MTDISNNDDFIDLDDVNERIEELETELEDEGSDFTDDGSTRDEAREELAALKALIEQCDGCDGPLIRDSYFIQYAQQLAEDIGAIDRNLGWPSCHIDWDAAADSLKMDYTSVQFDGVDYLIR